MTQAISKPANILITFFVLFAIILSSVTIAVAQEADTLKVGMVGVDIKTAAIIIAEQLDYFAEEGVNVEFEKISNLADGITAIDLGKLDVLPYGVIPSATFISQGTDVVVFGGTIAEGSEIVTLPENADAFNTAQDFIGKKIGCYRMETGHMVMKGYLREAGIDVVNDVQFIYLDSSPSIVEAIKKGEVDLGFFNSGYGYIAEKSGLAIAAHVGDFVSDFPCCRQTTSRASLTNKREALVKFEIAALRGYQTFMTDHDTSIKILSEYSGQDEDYVRAIMYGTDDYNKAMIISLDPNRTKVIEFYEIMKANGDISADTPYKMEDHIDTSIYHDALQTLLDREPENAIFLNLMEEYKINNE